VGTSGCRRHEQTTDRSLMGLCVTTRDAEQEVAGPLAALQSGR
jgi:hypothetical protein